MPAVKIMPDGSLILDQFKWANTKSKMPGGFETFPPGAYVCRIVKLEFQPRANGDVMGVFDVDVAEGPQTGHFASRAKTQGDWPFTAQYKRYVYRADNDELQPAFKGFVNFLKKQNPDAKIDDVTQLTPREFVDLLCGFTFGEEEYLSDGAVKVSCKIGFACEVDKVRAGKVKTPELKRLDESKRPQKPNVSVSAEEFNGVAEDDDLPF